MLDPEPNLIKNQSEKNKYHFPILIINLQVGCIFSIFLQSRIWDHTGKLFLSRFVNSKAQLLCTFGCDAQWLTTGETDICYIPKYFKLT